MGLTAQFLNALSMLFANAFMFAAVVPFVLVGARVTREGNGVAAL